ncbi:Coenzyme F420 hydrogenase/dehydrogenase, beta subunit C-terminal domain [Desulfothermus sp.]
MKTFFNLIQEVQKVGKCHHCGACVAFCDALNYGALEIGEDGIPRYKDINKCIECGLCYTICPEIHELDEELKRKVGWSEPIGRVLSSRSVRAIDENIRNNATDGGAVTALLLYLFDTGQINGAIVTKKVGKFERVPHLATTREEIINSAGFFFETSHGIHNFSKRYSEVATVEAFQTLRKKGLSRVALVASPCQILAFRKMELLGITPSESIRFCLGLFCSGNFEFNEQNRKILGEKFNFSWDDVEKINIKEELYITLKSGEKLTIPLNELDFMKKYACKLCLDYTAQFSDLSFGGLGSEDGWTTVLARTPKGRAALESAIGVTLEEIKYSDRPLYVTDMLYKIHTQAAKKKKSSKERLRNLGKSTKVSM